jgi:acetyl-CoA carboxylase alpha subunit
VDKVAADIKKNLVSTLNELNSKSVEELVESRYEKFRNMGEYIE